MSAITKGYISPVSTTQPFSNDIVETVAPFKSQLLKWIGNKQRFAHEIITFFPAYVDTYFEPFVGSAAVLGTLSPLRAIASDNFADLIGIWRMLKHDPDRLKLAYSERMSLINTMGKQNAYNYVRTRYNNRPNPEDLLFLSRTCYGGVVRFRKKDCGMSTPCRAHKPMPPHKFSERADEWRQRVRHTTFIHCDYKEVLKMAKRNDLIYCDPPYADSQKILYGAQSFKLSDLFVEIERCKSRGVHVVLSIDGSKQSGNKFCQIEIPRGLFKREVFVNCGRSMLKRFQMGGFSLEGEVVKDRLLLTY